MSKQLKHIEEQYSKAFESQSHTDLEWNNPPEFIFEEAIATVNKNKGRQNNRKALILFVFVMVIITSVAILYTQYRINGLEKRVISFKDSATKIENQSNPTTENKTIKIPALAQAASKQMKAKGKMILKKNDFATLESSDIKSTKLIAPVKEPISSNNNALPIDIKLRSEIQSQSLATKTSESLSLSQNTIHPLQHKEIAILESSPEGLAIAERKFIIIGLSHTDLENQTDKGASLYKVGVEVKRNFTSMSMEGELNSDQSLINYDNKYAGYGLELSSSRKLVNRLSIIGSIGYDRYKNQSQANTIYSYSKANEVPVSNGLASYSMTNLIETPLGEMMENTSLTVNPMQTSEGETLSQESNISQTLSTFSMNTGLSYDIINKGKFTMNTGILAGLNYNHRARSNMNSSLMMDNDIMSLSETKSKDIEGTRNFFGSLRFSLGASLELKNDFCLNFGLSHTQSVNAISLKDANPQFKLTNWHSSIGLTKHF